MKIVINMPEERYADIQRIANVQSNRRTPTVEQIIANGTPLPKGHGRLIDIEKMLDDVKKEDDGDGAIAFENIEELENLFDDAPTIIEADKETEE